MRSVFLAFTLLSAKFACCQQCQWAKSEGTWFADRNSTSCVDRQGNTFIVLQNYENITIGGNFYNWCGSPGSILVKYNTSGSVVWTRRMCVRNILGISIDNDGNCILAGRSFPGEFVQDHNGNDVIISHIDNHQKALIVKYTGNGVLLWANSYSLTKYSDGIVDVATDVNNNIFAIAGADSAFYSRFIVIKVDDTGSLIWKHSTPAVQYVSASQIAIDTFGSIIITGSGNAPFSLAGSNFNTAGDPMTFIIKLSSSGTINWVREQPGNIRYSDLSITSSGNIILSGQSYYMATTIGSVTVGSGHFFIAKYDSLANNIWVKSNSALSLFSAITDETYYVSGRYYTTAEFFQNGVILPDNGSHTIFLMCLDSSGSIKWVNTEHSAPGDFAEISRISADPFGEISLTGVFSGSLSFRPFELYAKDSASSVEGDVFVARYKNGLQTSTNQNINQQLVLQTFPNPAKGKFTVLMQPNVIGEIKYYVRDILGNCICSGEIKSPSEEVNLSGFPTGIYFFEALGPSGNSVVKIILQ